MLAENRAQFGRMADGERDAEARKNAGHQGQVFSLAAPDDAIVNLFKLNPAWCNPLLTILLKTVGQDVCPLVFSLLYYGVLGGTYAELGRTEETRKRFNAQDTSSHARLVSGSRMV